MHTLVGVVYALLKQRFNTKLAIGKSEIVYDWDGSATTVLRYSVKSDDSNVPSSVILKRSNTKTGTLFQDAAGLRFIHSIDDLNGLFPELYGVDHQHELLLMEDFNAPKEALLGNILFGDHRELATQALCNFQRALARLHLATRGQQSEYESIQGQFKKITPSRHRIHQLELCVAEFPTMMEKLGIDVPKAAHSELRQIATIIRDPNEFAAFTHGDGTPANAFYLDGEIKLFDLEASGFRHMLLDGTFARMRYIYSVWAREIPLDVQHLMFDAYQETLMDDFPLTGDDEVFISHYVGCCAAWLTALAMSLPDVLRTDHQWGRSSWRQRIVTAFEHLVVVSSELDQLPALREVSQHAVNILRKQWKKQELEMRPYPAFA